MRGLDRVRSRQSQVTLTDQAGKEYSVRAGEGRGDEKANKWVRNWTAKLENEVVRWRESALWHCLSSPRTFILTCLCACVVLVCVCLHEPGPEDSNRQPLEVAPAEKTNGLDSVPPPHPIFIFFPWRWAFHQAGELIKARERLLNPQISPP